MVEIRGVEPCPPDGRTQERILLCWCCLFGGVLAQRFSSRYRRNTKSSPIRDYFLYGGDKGSRTPDLLNAIQALSQLSYTPILYTNYITIFAWCQYGERKKMVGNLLLVLLHDLDRFSRWDHYRLGVGFVHELGVVVARDLAEVFRFGYA